MQAQSPGAKTPQILSTHPSHQTRISNLRKNAPQALAQAQQIKDSLNQLVIQELHPCFFLSFFDSKKNHGLHCSGQ